jgi:hypothetical protein
MEVLFYFTQLEAVFCDFKFSIPLENYTFRNNCYIS